ncbi:MAG TPA: endonuclease domain-containing protein [Terriglobia bacterium]|nr:endonuclease domain-containing protein [Terriglobia bacterium]
MRIPTARIRELRASPTEAEKAEWNLLRDRRLGAKFRRQFRIENGILDFYCFEHRLAIELDGGVHSQIDQMRKDAAKEDNLRTVGIRLLRIPNAMARGHPDEFVRKVGGGPLGDGESGRKVTSHPPPCGPPSPLRRGKLFLARARPRDTSHLLPGEKADRDRRSHPPSRAG